MGSGMVGLGLRYRDLGMYGFSVLHSLGFAERFRCGLAGQ